MAVFIEDDIDSKDNIDSADDANVNASEDEEDSDKDNLNEEKEESEEETESSSSEILLKEEENEDSDNEEESEDSMSSSLNHQGTGTGGQGRSGRSDQTRTLVPKQSLTYTLNGISLSFSPSTSPITAIHNVGVVYTRTSRPAHGSDGEKKIN